MFNFLENRLQKSLQKVRAKMTMSEADILEVTRDIKMALLEADVNLVVVKQFVANVKTKTLESNLTGQLNPSQHMIKLVRDELVATLGGKTKVIEVQGNPFVIMLIGLQGSGKTTTCAKLVKHFLKKKLISKPLMIACDVYRPAAIEQLVTLGKELQIDVFEQGAKISPITIAKNGLAKAKSEGYDLVIIDTAGRLAIDEPLMTEVGELKKLAKPHEILLTVDALSGQDIINVARLFHEKLNITGAIITKLDSDARGGAALSIGQMLKIPFVFVGVGEKVSALEVFHPDRMAERILGMGDVLSLIEQVEESVDEKKANKMLARIANGKFDLDDLLNQFEQMQKMGKMSKVMQMIPGLGSKIDHNQVDQAETKFATYAVLISSMTVEERKQPRLLKEVSRKNRVIKGSGRSNREFNSLMNDFERMQKQIVSIGKALKDGSFNPNMLKGLM